MTSTRYLIRDASASIEVDYDYIHNNPDWFKFSTSFIVDGITYREYIYSDAKVVTLYKKKQWWKFNSNSPYRPRVTTNNVMRVL